VQVVVDRDDDPGDHDALLVGEGGAEHEVKLVVQEAVP